MSSAASSSRPLPRYSSPSRHDSHCDDPLPAPAAAAAAADDDDVDALFDELP